MKTNYKKKSLKRVHKNKKKSNFRKYNIQKGGIDYQSSLSDEDKKILDRLCDNFDGFAWDFDDTIVHYPVKYERTDLEKSKHISLNPILIRRLKGHKLTIDELAQENAYIEKLFETEYKNANQSRKEEITIKMKNYYRQVSDCNDFPLNDSQYQINIESFFFNLKEFVDLVIYLVNKNKKVAIVSFGSKKNIEYILELAFRQYGIESPFNAETNIFGSNSISFFAYENLNDKKQDLLNAFRSELNPEKILFFDDDDRNVSIATKNKYKGVALIGKKSREHGFLTSDTSYVTEDGFSFKILKLIYSLIQNKKNFGFNLLFTELNNENEIIEELETNQEESETNTQETETNTQETENNKLPELPKGYYYNKQGILRYNNELPEVPTEYYYRNNEGILRYKNQRTNELIYNVPQNLLKKVKNKQTNNQQNLLKKVNNKQPNNPPSKTSKLWGSMKKRVGNLTNKITKKLKREFGLRRRGNRN